MHASMRMRVCVCVLGVSNARFWFDKVRVPLGSLLSRYGGVDADGAYSSFIGKTVSAIITRPISPLCNDVICTINTPHSHMGMVVWGVEQ